MAELNCDFVQSSGCFCTDAPPGPPSGITANNYIAATPGRDEVWLEWNASAGATRYLVKRATASGGSYANVVTNLTTTGYLDTNLLTGTNYFYAVSAANSFGESTNSNPVSVTPGVPSQPRNGARTRGRD
jgi:fibronectin type 3 domain-containing protein